ncbi:MAG: CoA transferase [Proteobacteria bacterium]|nr:CoA transferase [Pseudomonadota bacterium]
MDILDGIRIVSFNHFLMGPVGIQLLADLGADVIAIEPTGGAFQRHWGGANKSVDGQSLLFLLGNRNKRSLALDLKKPEGLAIARKLAAGADVVAENFRPGVMEKLGLGYESLKAENPALIYASASGYGPDGPYAERPGQDLLIQAMSGLMAITGSREGGARAVGVSAADHHGAALLAMGILAALVGRLRSGRGRRVDVNLLSSAIDLQLESFSCYLNGEVPDSVRQPKYISGWYYPAPYGIYPTEDGEVAISLSDMATLAEALGLPELAAVTPEEAFTRNQELAESIAGAMAQKPTAAWLEILERHRIWHARVNDYAEVVADPQVRHNRNFITVPGATGAPVTLVSHPVRYDGAAPEVRLPPQPLGAQNAEILAELGYGTAEIQRLEAKGVISRDKGAVAGAT